MDKVFKGNEATMFYSQFTGELGNRISGRYTITGNATTLDIPGHIEEPESEY